MYRKCVQRNFNYVGKRKKNSARRIEMCRKYMYIKVNIKFSEENCFLSPFAISFKDTYVFFLLYHIENLKSEVTGFMSTVFLPFSKNVKYIFYAKQPVCHF